VAVSVAVYNKALQLSNQERQSTTLGELANLLQVDASKSNTHHRMAVLLLLRANPNMLTIAHSRLALHWPS